MEYYDVLEDIIGLGNVSNFMVESGIYFHSKNDPLLCAAWLRQMEQIHDFNNSTLLLPVG